VQHRFAEKVVGADFDSGVLAGQVERLVGFRRDGEGGEIVAADTYLRAGLGNIIAFGGEGVAAEAETRGNLPVGGGDAEV
jgi:hypothetical protein